MDRWRGILRVFVVGWSVWSAASGAGPCAAETGADPKESAFVEEVQVEGRADKLVGIADSATEGTVGEAELDRRALLRPAEVVEAVPGVIATQHSGAGKANQYFLRGFNLDHGTDFRTTLAEVPVNMPSHAHGQGYTDLNFLIPELVRGVQYKKGPYYADEGDFSAAGAVHIRLVDTLPRPIATAVAGEEGYARALVASSRELGGRHVLGALELLTQDGPWVVPEDYGKLNAVMRYGGGNDARGYSVTAMGYHGRWNATDQVARRAVESGLISRFGTLDPTDGGRSARYSLSAEMHRETEEASTHLSGYGLYYDLDLFSNFTYFLRHLADGDQFEQADRRWAWGVDASRQWRMKLARHEVQNTLGFQLRVDSIRNGLYDTRARQRLSTTRQDDILQAGGAPWFENRVRWSRTLRTIAGLRADGYHADVKSDNALNSGTVGTLLASPKIAVILGPWAKTEYYVNLGTGFHSNDARGATIRVDPRTGNPVGRVTPLVRARGADLGVRTEFFPKLESSLSFFVLDLDSELLFAGDAGTTEASRPSRRTGFELANFYRPSDRLTLDLDLAFAKARFTDEDPAGDQIPGAIRGVLAAGVSYQRPVGFFGGLRVRYVGPRPLVENDRVRSASSTLVTARAGWTFRKPVSVGVEAFNLLDARVSDIDYLYTSRLPGEPRQGVEDVHTHPAEPRSARVFVAGRF